MFIEEDKIYFINMKRRDGLFHILKKQGVPVRASVLKGGILSGSDIADAHLEKNVLGVSRKSWDKLYVISVFYLHDMT